jgi:succinoglycan biosynthesis transport protein ExoP
MSVGPQEPGTLIPFEKNWVDTPRVIVSDYPTPPTAGAGVREYWSVLLKRRMIILAILVTALAVTALASLKATKIYEAQGRIALLRDTTPVIGSHDSDASNEDWDYTVSLATQVNIIQSDNLALEVAKRLHWGEAPATAANNIADVPAALSPAQERALIAQVRGGLHVEVLTGTRIIEIRYDSSNPSLAADVVNATIATYIEDSYRSKVDNSMRSSEFLQQQLESMRVKMEAAQEKLVRYQKDNDILGVDEKQNIITAKLDELNKEVTAAQEDRIQKEVRYRQSVGNPEFLAKDALGPLERLRDQQSKLRQQYAQLSTQFGPSYPKVLEVENQLKDTDASIDAELGRLSEGSRRQFTAAVQREKMLQGALEQQKREANRLNEKAIEYNMLKRDVESNRQIYESAQQKLKEASVNAGMKSNNIRVVDSARVPSWPVRPNVPRNLELALVLGLIGGIAAAFIAESLDNTVRTGDDLHVISSVPLLGVIPVTNEEPQRKKGLRHANSLALTAGGAPSETVTSSRPRSLAAEAFRALRTSILLSSAQRAPKVLIVSSPLAKEGKTTTSVNVAIVLAQRNGRVLLIDADLRRPAVSKALGISAPTGLSELLTGNATFESCLVQSPSVPNLFVLAAGSPPPYPAELLGSSAMLQLLQRCRKEFDHIVIDTPPVLAVTDAVLLSPEADGVVMVVRSGVTEKQALRRALEILAHVNAKVTGVVMNAVDIQNDGYYYGASSYYS